MERMPETKLVSEGPAILKATLRYKRRRTRIIRKTRAKYLRMLRDTPFWLWPAIFWQYQRELRHELSRITPSGQTLWLSVR